MPNNSSCQFVLELIDWFVYEQTRSFTNLDCYIFKTVDVNLNAQYESNTAIPQFTKKKNISYLPS